jgi:hypothetical protein
MDNRFRKPKKESELDSLFRALVTGSSNDAILGQEADGQTSFVNSDTLPSQMRPEDRAALEAAGVVFGDLVEGDYLFEYVRLPAGWKKVSTEHSMHSDLLDEKGRKRAGIFYKAAFYDRKAELHCIRRFNIDVDYDKLKNGSAEAYVLDCSQEVFRTQGVPFDVDNYQLRIEAQKAATDAATAWLVERYPDWKNAAAYWDEE